MVEADSLESVRSALAPVEALRGEQSQLESWVRESFATLETLHHELSEWQRDLARQQAQLDQREAGVAEAEAHARDESRELAARELQLSEARAEIQQLEAENVEQLQTLSTFERQLVGAQAELRAVRKHADDQAAAVDTERVRAIEERRQLAGEFREMRRMLECQTQMLVSLGANFPDDDVSACFGHSPVDKAGETPSAAAEHAAELRRRAAVRRATRQSP